MLFYMKKVKVLQIEWFLRLNKKNLLHIQNDLGILLTARR